MTIEQPAGIGLRERRRSQTRAEIAEAAIDLFERQGVATTTVEDIAAAAGISPRTFYRLCGTKEQAVLDDEEIAGAMQDAVAMLDAGATRLGTSGSATILGEARRLEAGGAATGAVDESSY